jgi:predicted dehydrogenase
MKETLKIGMIGLDTSHCEAFVKIINDASNPHHIPGGRVSVAYPGGSPDFEVSISRVEGITKTLQEKYQVAIVNSPEEAAEQSDAILLTSVDGRVHLEQFKKIVSYGKPVFIDKPFAVSSNHAEEMISLSLKHYIPLMSASSIRCSDFLSDILNKEDRSGIIGADCYGPMNLELTQPGLYWYGIHTVDTLYRILGKGCQHVTATTNKDYELVVGVWRDGRMGTVRGNRLGNNNFGAAVHLEHQTESIIINKQTRPIYASLLEEVMEFFRTGKPGIDPLETMEIIRFIEAANESREKGRTVNL